MAQYAISDEARRLIAAAATEAVAQAAESDRYDGAMRVLIAKPAGDPMRNPDLIGASGVEIRIHVNKRSPNAVVISEFSYGENRKARNEAATLGQTPRLHRGRRPGLRRPIAGCSRSRAPLLLRPRRDRAPQRDSRSRSPESEIGPAAPLADDWLNADLSQMDAITAALREAAGI